jgi:excinuclease ABC subunit A
LDAWAGFGMNKEECFRIWGVTTHNLKNLDLEVPLHKITAVTGVSGSGKTSLVFDTIHDASYQRYLACLSGFTKQHLKSAITANFEGVEGIPASIAIRQVRPSLNPRSSVGTVTEIYDLLKNIFPYLAELVCCGKVLKSYSPELILKVLHAHGEWGSHPAQGSVLILAPLDHWTLTGSELKSYLEEQGFRRLYSQDETLMIDQVQSVEAESMFCVIDRIRLTGSNDQRLLEALRLAMRLGGNRVRLILPDGSSQWFAKERQCMQCGTSYRRLSPVLFSTEHPLGACHQCHGFGFEVALNQEKIIKDRRKSLQEEGVDLFNFGQREAVYSSAIASAKTRGIDASKPFSDYSKKDWDWLFAGDGEFCGVQGFITWLESKRYKPHYRIFLAKFRQYIPCETCRSSGLGLEARKSVALGKAYTELRVGSLQQFGQWLDQVEDSALPALHRGQGAVEALAELRTRLKYLLRIGVGYLSLDRKTKTLSGGEFQRISMAKVLSSELTESMICLDEPTCGLHPVDTANLVGLMESLRDQGNTIMVVEHSEDMIRSCDHVLEIGPNAGEKGGSIVFSGLPRAYKHRTLPLSKRTLDLAAGKYFGLMGVRTNNLQDIEVKFLAAALNCVCGVSGSGKSSLIASSLYPVVSQVLLQDAAKSRNKSAPTEFGQLCSSLIGEKVIRSFSQVHLVSQRGLGRSSRSTIGTFLGIFQVIRNLYAKTPFAKRLRLLPKHFSFNVPGGRCETCKGLGTVIEDLSYLGEIRAVCLDCGGLRFQEAILKVEYQGLNFAKILDLSVSDALEFFADDPTLVSVLKLAADMGLGYLKLGQTTDSFSGGEAQRLKLLDILRQVEDRRSQLVIFDEPSAGLSDYDVGLLFKMFRKLTEQGHTVITVEHHMAMCAASDWLVEVGPGASEDGGTLVYQGPPRGILTESRSRTAEFLRPYFVHES